MFPRRASARTRQRHARRVLSGELSHGGTRPRREFESGWSRVGGVVSLARYVATNHHSERISNVDASDRKRRQTRNTRRNRERRFVVK